jgi:hypothetical protein
MNTLRITLTILISALLASTAAGEVRDPGVERWISYAILGPQNDPYPTTYIATDRFKSEFMEFLTVLPPTRYELVVQFTRAQFARDECPGIAPAEDVWFSVELTEHDRGRTRKCILPHALACKYLAGLVHLKRVKWSVDELQPIRTFMGADSCLLPPQLR